jgi:hypothetical protein
MIVTAGIAIDHHAIVTSWTQVISDLVIGLGLSHIYNPIVTADIAFKWLPGIDLSVQFLS